MALTTALRARQAAQQEDPMQKSALRPQDPDTMTALPGQTPTTSPLGAALSRARAFEQPAPVENPLKQITLADYLAKKRQESGGLA